MPSRSVNKPGRGLRTGADRNPLISIPRTKIFKSATGSKNGNKKKRLVLDEPGKV